MYVGARVLLWFLGCKERVVPIYEFVCQSCGHEFEEIRSFSDNSVPACSVCQSKQVVRRMGRPAIHFKGSGWYITDSKKSGKESAVGSSSNGSEKKQDAGSDAASDAAKSESKGETQAQTKTDSKIGAGSESAKAAAD
jgi:putative FmdB family regulatory protein